MAENQIKLAKTPWDGLLVGYAEGLRGYCIWNPTTDEFCFKKIFSSTFQKTQQRDSATEAMKTTLFLSVCATLLVYSMQEKECDFVAKINIFVKKIIKNFVTDKSLHAVYIGCAKAFILGDSKDCNAKKFKMPQVKECEIAIKYPELKHKLEKHNLHEYTEFIENVLNSNDMDSKEICTEFNEEGDKVLAKIKELKDAASGKDPATYKELQEFITEGMNPASKKLAYKLTNQEQLAGSKNGYRQVFEIMTGGGPSFGIP
uniref:Uncharacterized protein n=1 Tax=Strigamia maritima TaxID=126957 RepID=T1J9A9_STRMM